MVRTSRSFRHGGGSVLDQQTTSQQVRDALAAVRDPELDRALTELGFVDGVTIDGGRVHVRLRLPSYSTPDSAWLVTADARAAVAALAWVELVEICLGAIATGRESEVEATPNHPGCSWAEPVDVGAGRQGIRRKAFGARHYEILCGLLERGIPPAELCRMHVGDLITTPGTAVYLQRRSELGLPVGDEAPLAVTEDGRPVSDAEIDDHLARIRRIAVGG
jgi:metal-sulfur cluster biosynthetic enzyme